MAELEDAPWATEGASDLPDAPWASAPAEPSLRERMQTPLTRGMGAVGSKAIEGFKEGFGDQPWGAWQKPEDVENYPKTAAAWKLAGFPVEVAGRTFSGGVNALRHGAAETYTQLGGDPDEGRRFGRDIAGMAESRMFDVGQHVPKPREVPTGVRVPEEPLPKPEPPGGVPPVEGGWYSPAEPRPDLKVGDRETKLLPHDYQPEPDTMGRYGVGAAASPGGPLHGMLPETLGMLKEDLGEFTPGTLGQRLEDMSPHMPFAHISEQTRGAAGGLYSHPGQSKVEIYNTVNQLARERPERLETVADRAFGPAENTVETQKLLRDEKAQVAAPFWQRFRSTPIEPTQRLASLEPRLRKTGAWKYAEDQLGIEGASTTEKARFPEEEGSEAPTPAFYEVVRQGLNKKIAKLYSEAGDSGPEVARLVKLYNEVTDAIDAHPDQAVAGLWKEGREASGRYAKALEAMATGERLMTQHIHEYKVPEILDRFDDWQKEYLVKGVRKWLGDQLGKKGTGLATINNILTGPTQRKITQVIGQDKADALFRDLEHERQMIEHEADIIGNKRTGASAPGRKLQADRFGAPEGGMSDILGKAGNFIRHPVRTVTGSALEAGQRALDTKAAQKAARMREELARVHTLQGPERDAVARHLIGDEPMGEPSPRAPRPAPAAPEPARSPMNAMDATEVLRAHGWDQASINRLGAGETRAQVAKYLQEKHPNGPPPKPVADFPADREVGMPQRPQPAPAAMPESPIHPKGEKPLSLMEWIRKQGGISPDDPLVSDVRAMFGNKNPGGIIRKGGKRLDKLREGAVGEKYFLDQGDITGGEASTDVNTLLDAMVREADGQKQYPLGSDMSRVRNSKDMEARNREQQRELEFSPEARRLDRELSQYGVTRDMVPTDVRQRAIEMLRSGVEKDAVEAFEKATNEKLAGEAQGDRAAEVGEGLEPSPQSSGMAARGNRATAEGQSGNGQDVRGAGERDRAEKEPLRLKVLERGRPRTRAPTNLTRDQLERMDINDLDRMAYGHVTDEKLTLNPDDIKLRYPDDMVNPEHKFAKQGMKWVKSVDFSEPVQVSIGRDGKFYLEDGHHRYFAAKKLGKSLDAVIEKIDGKPIETILKQGALLDKPRPGRPIKTERMRMGEDVNQAILKAGALRAKGYLPIFRGESSYNRGGNFYTPDREWARQFTQSGQDSEVLRHAIRARDVFDPPSEVYAGDPDAVDAAIASARKGGFKAVRLSEGAGQPPSVFVFNKSAINRSPQSIIGRSINRASGGRVDASAINSNPTEAQKEAGNYAKDHVNIHGLDITIENAKGHKRSGVDKGGKPWSVALPAHYGYIKKTEGADGDHVDVYLGPHLKSSRVFVVDQKDAETGKFDEHKAFIGFASAKQARNCYLKAFSDGKGRDRLGAMHEADIDGFKTWLADGDTTKPVGKKAA